MYSKGNDVAADCYASKLADDQAYEESVDAIADRLMADTGWRALNIDALMSSSDCTDGVTDFAIEMAEFTEHEGLAVAYFRSIMKRLRARAYDQAEYEIALREREAKRDNWLGEDRA